MKLTIEGRGLGTQYHIVVHGNAKPTNLSNPGDTVTKSLDDNTTIISGYVADFKDQFKLEKGAKLGAISSTEPVDLYLGGKSVDTGPHAAAATWQQSDRNDGDSDSGDSSGDGTPDVSQLRKRVDNLAEKLNNARISFESDGS